MSSSESGYLPDGHPYNRLGTGPRPIVVFPGLGFENKPAAGMERRLLLSTYRFLEQDFTVWVVNRRPGLRPGTTIADMGDAYAEMIKAQFGGPVDVIGVSTGGSIALEFALDHPDLVRRLVVHSAAYRLGDVGRQLQRRLGDLARRRRWGQALSLILSFLFLPQRGIGRVLTTPIRGLFWVMGRLTVRPKDPSDVIVTVEAEDTFDIGPRLGEIRVPILIVAGGRDPFYPAELFEATARGIPGARLHLEPRGGHVPAGEAVTKTILAFLAEEPAAPTGTVAP